MGQLAPRHKSTKETIHREAPTRFAYGAPKAAVVAVDGGALVGGPLLDDDDAGDAGDGVGRCNLAGGTAGTGLGNKKCCSRGATFSSMPS